MTDAAPSYPSLHHQSEYNVKNLMSTFIYSKISKPPPLFLKNNYFQNRGVNLNMTRLSEIYKVRTLKTKVLMEWLRLKNLRVLVRIISLILKTSLQYEFNDFF